MSLTQAHIDSTIDIGEAGLEFAERLAGFGARTERYPPICWTFAAPSPAESPRSGFT